MKSQLLSKHDNVQSVIFGKVKFLKSSPTVIYLPKQTKEAPGQCFKSTQKQPPAVFFFKKRGSQNS